MMYKLTVRTKEDYDKVVRKAAENNIKIQINYFTNGTADIFLECTKKEWKRLK